MKTNQIVFFLLIFVCTACVPATPSKEEVNDQLENMITSKNELWAKLDIESYQIKIHESSVWADYNFMITVKNDQVTNFEASCGDALLDVDSSFCKQVLSDISPDSYTIEGLFDQLKKSRIRLETDEDITSSWSDSISIAFDPQYHYPKLIDFDIPEMADEEYTTEVLTFEILQN